MTTTIKKITLSFSISFSFPLLPWDLFGIFFRFFFFFGFFFCALTVFSSTQVRARVLFMLARRSNYFND